MSQSSFFLISCSHMYTRFGYTKVGGEVSYGPFDSRTFEQKYRGEAVYNQEVRMNNAAYG